MEARPEKSEAELLASGGAVCRGGASGVGGRNRSGAWWGPGPERFSGIR